jgi:nucleotide-binding universal stress UspA family protein
MYSRVVVPLDGSLVAETALKHATEFASLLQVPLHLVRVVDAHTLEQTAGTGIGFDYSVVESLLQTEIDDARAYIEKTAQDLASSGRDVTHAIVTGPVARSIVDQLEAGDLLVIASHGRTGVARWFLGSVAEEVMRHAKVPVLLVRHHDDNT